jgi:hypothetical protein
VPWLKEPSRGKIGKQLIDLWAAERALEQSREAAMSHVDALGIESDESRKRWKVSKAPQ